MRSSHNLVNGVFKELTFVPLPGVITVISSAPYMSGLAYILDLDLDLDFLDVIIEGSDALLIDGEFIKEMSCEYLDLDFLDFFSLSFSFSSGPIEIVFVPLLVSGIEGLVLPNTLGEFFDSFEDFDTSRVDFSDKDSVSGDC